MGILEGEERENGAGSLFKEIITASYIHTYIYIYSLCSLIIIYNNMYNIDYKHFQCFLLHHSSHLLSSSAPEFDSFLVF